MRLEQMTGAYKRSKFQAEQVALEFAGSGFPVVIVNPTAPMGDHDFKPTPTGKIVVDYLKGAMPAFVDTGLNLVDVRGYRRGPLCWLPSAADRASATYSGCENLTLEQILDRLARVSEGTGPALANPVRGGLCGRTGKHRLGQSDRPGAARAAGCGEDGASENVRFVRQGEARIGIQSRTGGWRPETRRRLVPGERLRLMSYVGIRSGGGSGILGPAAACGESRQAELAARFRQESLAERQSR